MTEINPNNYPGANLTAVGRASGSPEYPRYDREGKYGYKELSVAVSQDYKDKDGNWVDRPAIWVAYVQHEDRWDKTPVGKGDLVRIDNARMETREYEDRDGNPKIGITAKFGSITVLESKGGDEEAPF